MQSKKPDCRSDDLEMQMRILKQQQDLERGRYRADRCTYRIVAANSYVSHYLCDVGGSDGKNNKRSIYQTVR